MLPNSLVRAFLLNTFIFCYLLSINLYFKYLVVLVVVILTMLHYVVLLVRARRRRLYIAVRHVPPSKVMPALVIQPGFFYKSAMTIATAAGIVGTGWSSGVYAFPFKFFGLDQRDGECAQRAPSGKGVLCLNLQGRLLQMRSS